MSYDEITEEMVRKRFWGNPLAVAWGRMYSEAERNLKDKLRPLKLKESDYTISQTEMIVQGTVHIVAARLAKQIPGNKKRRLLKRWRKNG